MNTLDLLTELLGGILSCDPMDLSASFKLTEANGVSPIDVAKLAIACEQRLGFRLYDEHIAQWKTLGDAQRDIDALLEEGLGKPTLHSDEERTAWFYE